MPARRRAPAPRTAPAQNTWRGLYDSTSLSVGLCTPGCRWQYRADTRSRDSPRKKRTVGWMVAFNTRG